MEYFNYAMIIILVGILFGGGYWAYRDEKRKWNGGKCLPHGITWRHFDNDSQGGRGYKCDKGCRHWVSYPGIDTTTNGLKLPDSSTT